MVHGIDIAQAITQLTFPFPSGCVYSELYEKLTDEDRRVYEIEKEEGIVWVRRIEVGNTVFVKD